MKVQRYQSTSDFYQLRTAWNELLQKMPDGDVFLSWEWLYTWWKQYESRFQLDIRIIVENDKIVGIAPLMIEEKRYLNIPIRILTNIGYPPPDVGGFILADQRNIIIDAIVEDIIRNKNEWDIIQLREFQETNLQEKHLIKFKPFSKVESNTTRHYLIHLEKDWETFKNQISNRIISDLNRCQKRLEKIGCLSFVRYCGEEIKLEHLHAIFQINSSARNPQGYEIPSEKRFHLNLCEEVRKKCWGDISFLCFNNEPIAYHYGFIYNKRANLWRTGYNPAYNIYSPGKLLLLKYLQDSYKRELSVVDWLRGDHDYKEKWNAISIPFYHYNIVQKKLYPLMFYSIWPRIRSKVRKLIEQTGFFKAILINYDNLSEKQVLRNVGKKSSN
jgi:CelD/BcsL family acetyltransferase involved in cellulose biosynthesis